MQSPCMIAFRKPRRLLGQPAFLFGQLLGQLVEFLPSCGHSGFQAGFFLANLLQKFFRSVMEFCKFLLLLLLSLRLLFQKSLALFAKGKNFLGDLRNSLRRDRGNCLPSGQVMFKGRQLFGLDFPPESNEFFMELGEGVSATLERLSLLFEFGQCATLLLGPLATPLPLFLPKTLACLPQFLEQIPRLVQ